MVWLRKIKTCRKSKTVYGYRHGLKQGLMLQIMSLGRRLPTGKKKYWNNEKLIRWKNHEIISWIKSAL